ncbi:hypothetical protein [Streptomyces sp. NRRL WC-3742]|uniref:hypothetical protein n=1 Tax=Streptomyces sp. NRRL WC-3742 TaxID=1463934 RepID=UPI00068E9F86|nr:hypothetical protein [Streptomyces sp. NRRL WC-3742]
MTTGHTAVAPRPYMSGVGPLVSAARNWLYSLNGELAGIGAYAGTLSIAAFIARSEMGELATSAMPDQVGPLVDPDDRAEHYWGLYTKRDRIEQIHPQPDAG